MMIDERSEALNVHFLPVCRKTNIGVKSSNDHSFSPPEFSFN